MFDDLNGLIRAIDRYRGTPRWDAALTKLTPRIRSAIEKLLQPDMQLQECLPRAFEIEQSAQNIHWAEALAAVAAHVCLELFTTLLAVPDWTGRAYERFQ